MRIKNPTLAHFRHFSSLFTKSPPLHLSRTLYKSTLFMQNKPNFQKATMNVNIYYTKAYKNETAFRRAKNKPNSNPIKANSRKAQMNINSLITKDYKNFIPLAGYKNKPNSNPISESPKMNVNVFSTKDYENKTAFRLQKNKPKQTQSLAPLFRVIYTLRGLAKFHPLMVKTGSSFVAANTALMSLFSPGSKLIKLSSQKTGNIVSPLFLPETLNSMKNAI